MMAEIIVSHGLCSAIRPKVMTALEPYEFKNLKIETWGEGIYGTDSSERVSDTNKMARIHYARITVSDAAAAWAERLLWQAGTVWLETPKLNKGLEWSAPADCKAGAHGTLGRGKMPTPWRDQQAKQSATKPKKAAKPAQRKPDKRSSIRDFLRRL